MKKTALSLAALIFVPHACFAGPPQPAIFATFAEDGPQLRNALVLVESIRSFGGLYGNAPVWIYVPSCILRTQKDLIEKCKNLGARVTASDANAESKDFRFAGKVFAAARAEAEASGKAAILVWMDNDTAVLRQPDEFSLAKGKSLGYRPVMNRNIGSPYSKPPDAFWKRVFGKLSVRESALFPMKTAADRETIRPYFNAGLLVVRPERGILAQWARSFPALYRDSVIGAVLNLLGRGEMVQLSDSYNYPIFFERMYGGARRFDSLDGVVTMRHDVFFQNPMPGWDGKLKGPVKTISWLKERFAGEGARKEDSSTKMRFRFEHGGGGRSFRSA
jgi:hypothetical protein